MMACDPAFGLAFRQQSLEFAARRLLKTAGQLGICSFEEWICRRRLQQPDPRDASRLAWD